MDFVKGERVRQERMPQRGIGKVVEDSAGGNVRVLFYDEGEKLLNIERAGVVRVPESEASYSTVGFEVMIDHLRTTFPEGFSDARFLKAERNYKVAAHELTSELLDRERIQALLSAGDYREVVRRALQAASRPNLIDKFELMALKDGLQPDEKAKLFSESLFELLYGEGEMEHRFHRFVFALQSAGAARWTVATYFLYFIYPDEHMFLKPEVTRKAAAACGHELHYRSEPNWRTYSSLLEFSRILVRDPEAAGLKPRDMIDVQSFIWVAAETAKGKYKTD